MATSRLSDVEVASALTRRCRQGDLSRAERDRALSALRNDIAAVYVVEVFADVTAAAVDLLGRYPLRAADAIQLASCLHLRQQVADPVKFVAYDDRLLEAARAEGVTIFSARSLSE